MIESKRITLDCSDGASVEFSFLKNGDVEVIISNASIRTISKEEWSSFINYIEDEFLGERIKSRTCSTCGNQGHNSRTCTEKKLTDNPSMTYRP